MKRLSLFLIMLVVASSFLADLSNLGFVGVSFASGTDKRMEKNRDGILELKWKDLIPTDFHPEEILTKNNFDQLDDLDPRVQKIYQAYLAEIDKAPIVKELDGRMVKIPGYVIPLETDGQVTSEFLLVPSFGACIHVPPPPANQIVHVQAVGKGTTAARKWYDTVWVIGRLSIERLENDIGNAGYTIMAERVEPYTENPSLSE